MFTKSANSACAVRLRPHPNCLRATSHRRGRCMTCALTVAHHTTAPSWFRFATPKFTFRCAPSKLQLAANVRRNPDVSSHSARAKQ